MAKVTTKVKPLGDRLLIRPEDREATTASGLVLPDTAKEKPQEGTVIAAGSGRVTEDGKTVPLEINEGDKVLYAKYAGTELRLDDEDLLIVSERDVLAIIS
jgi:chaperonin GroES